MSENATLDPERLRLENEALRRRIAELEVESQRLESTQEALAQSEENFRLLTEKAVVGVYVIQDGKMAYVNPAFAKAFGYRAQEIIGTLAPQDLIHPDDLAAVTKRLGERLEGKTEDVSITYRAMRKDGSTIHIEVFGALIQFHGRPGVMGTLIEVTERVRTHAALAASEALARGILDNVQDAYVRADADGRILLVSPSAVSLYGYDSSEDMIGLPTVALYESQDVRRVILEELQRAGSLRDHVGLGRKKDGTLFWVSLNARLLRDEQGQVTGAECFVRDISERLQSDERLRESQERYRRLFDASPDGIVLIGEDGCITEANLAEARMFGYAAAADLTGVHATRLVAPPSRDYSRQIMRRRLSGEDVRPVEYQLLRQDGTTFHGEVSATILRNTDGVVSGYICVTHDVSERKQAQARMAEQLDELRRWHQATLGREGRVLDLKKEVNELLAQAGQPPRYPSALEEEGEK